MLAIHEELDTFPNDAISGAEPRTDDHCGPFDGLDGHFPGNDPTLRAILQD
jgi:hypothetical protein